MVFGRGRKAKQEQPAEPGEATEAASRQVSMKTVFQEMRQ